MEFGRKWSPKKPATAGSNTVTPVRTRTERLETRIKGSPGSPGLRGRTKFQKPIYWKAG